MSRFYLLDTEAGSQQLLPCSLEVQDTHALLSALGRRRLKSYCSPTDLTVPSSTSHSSPPSASLLRFCPWCVPRCVWPGFGSARLSLWWALLVAERPGMCGRHHQGYLSPSQPCLTLTAVGYCVLIAELYTQQSAEPSFIGSWCTPNQECFIGQSTWEYNI